MNWPLVTIGIPVYKRLHYLNNVLKNVRSQDYPHIELLVSDNGMNGKALSQLVSAHYAKPFRIRHNQRTVPLSTHFNQILDSANGEYFVLLADDDEISPNYVSELVSRLEHNPRAAVALGRQEIIDEQGFVIRRSREVLPDCMEGPAFIRAAWHDYRFRYECFATTLARTAVLKACGRYPQFHKDTHNDDALLIKLCLHNQIVLSSKCTFRWRSYEQGHGWTISIWELAADSRDFLNFLDTDPQIKAFASAHAAEWKELKAILVRMTWRTYWNRWQQIYRRKLPRLEWLKASFALPFIPDYYRELGSYFIWGSAAAVGRRVKRLYR